MIVVWEAEDGYVGGGRPQETEIPDDELAECENDAERDQLLNDYVEDDFRNKVTWRILRMRKG